MIYIRFFGPLEQLMPEKNAAGFWQADFDGKTVTEALAGIDFGAIKYNVLLNNVRAEQDDILKDGDKLSVMPLLAGG